MKLQLLVSALFETLYMVSIASFFACIIGLLLGIVLTLVRKDGLKPSFIIHFLISFIVNIGRSIPFAILIIAIFPFTRLIVGTSIGTTAAIVPLTVTAAPFFARIVEDVLSGVSREIIDAAKVMGAKPSTIIWRVLIPESLPQLIDGLTITVVTLIGYSAMAGLVGGGGLGKVAIQYGYQRFDPFLMIATLVIILALVWVVQKSGKAIAHSILKKRGIA